MVKNFVTTSVVVVARTIATLLLGAIGGLISGAIIDRIWPTNVLSSAGNEVSLAAFGVAVGIIVGGLIGLLIGFTDFRVARGLDWAIVAGLSAYVATQNTGHAISESIAVMLVCSATAWLAAWRADMYIDFPSRRRRLSVRTIASYALGFLLITATVMRGLAEIPS